MLGWFYSFDLPHFNVKNILLLKTINRSRQQKIAKVCKKRHKHNHGKRKTKNCFIQKRWLYIK